VVAGGSRVLARALQGAALIGSAAALQLQQVIPVQRLVETLDLLGNLDLAALAPEDRPYTIVNFIASADGRATFHGRSGPLGDEPDHEIFHGLREQVDAVMAGTVTVRVERYGRLTRNPERRERRARAGRTPEPLLSIVSRSGHVPTEAPVFSEPDARIVVFVPPEADLDETAAKVEVVRLDPGEMTLTTAMRRLRSDFGIRSLLCEGGPTLFGALLEERLVDELFLTLAPKLTGGGMSPTISNGPELVELLPLELRWALDHASSLYLRYAVVSR
jgi:riboflavin-specific deaminase-like protein